MLNTSQHPVRRAAVGVLAGTLAFTGGALAVGISPATALPGFAFDRLAGTDRFATAAAIATDRFGTNAPTVILANGINFPDALAGNYLAGAEGAPILLTLPGSLPAPTKAALASLNTDNIRIVGGTAAVSQAVENELKALGYTVDRVAGTDRYKTAAAIAADPGAAFVGSTASGKTAIVASGEGFADALAAGPLAVDEQFPILLTTPATLRPETNTALDSLAIDHVLIVGGTAAVSPAVRSAIEAKGITVEVLAGTNRSATAVAIADYAITNLGFSDSHVNLARGDNGPSNDGFADALSGGPHAGAEAAPILLTLTPTSNSPETLGFLTDNSGTLVDGHIFGGSAAVSAAVEQEAEDAAAGAAPALDPFNTLTVTPTAAATLQLADEATPAQAASDDRVYTATGLDEGETYRITLVNAESITTDAAGNKTFLSSADANSASGFSVDIGTDIADITSINNMTVAPGVNTITTTPVNGSITFTVDGVAPGTVVPAVYYNGGPGGTPTTGGTSIRLETSATAAGQRAPATETFGLGGPTTFTAPEGANGAITGPVTSVDKASDSFFTGTSGDTRRYNYDANDLFTIGGVSSGLAVFEAALSSGDGITGTYTQDPAGVSTFALDDSNPAAPLTVSAESGTGAASNDITVTVTFPVGTETDSVIIQRAPVTGVGSTDETNTGTVGTFATVGTVTPTAAQITAGSLTFVDNDVAAGTYRYQAALVNDGDQSAFVADPNNEASTAPAAADTTGPVAVDSRVSTDAGLASTADTGDVFTISFGEALAAPVAGDSLRLTDADGTVVDVVNGTNATFSLNAVALTSQNGAARPAGTVLTVTLTGAPTVVTAGTTPGLQFPATITNSTGLDDAAGNRISVTTGERVLDVAANTTP